MNNCFRSLVNANVLQQMQPVEAIANPFTVNQNPDSILPIPYTNINSSPSNMSSSSIPSSSMPLNQINNNNNNTSKKVLITSNKSRRILNQNSQLQIPVVPMPSAEQDNNNGTKSKVVKSKILRLANQSFSKSMVFDENDMATIKGSNVKSIDTILNNNHVYSVPDDDNKKKEDDIHAFLIQETSASTSTTTTKDDVIVTDEQKIRKHNNPIINEDDAKMKNENETFQKQVLDKIKIINQTILNLTKDSTNVSKHIEEDVKYLQIQLNSIQSSISSRLDVIEASQKLSEQISSGSRRILDLSVSKMQEKIDNLSESKQNIDILSEKLDKHQSLIDGLAVKVNSNTTSSVSRIDLNRVNEKIESCISAQRENKLILAENKSTVWTMSYSPHAPTDHVQNLTQCAIETFDFYCSIKGKCLDQSGVDPWKLDMIHYSTIMLRDSVIYIQINGSGAFVKANKITLEKSKQLEVSFLISAIDRNEGCPIVINVDNSKDVIVTWDIVMTKRI